MEIILYISFKRYEWSVGLHSFAGNEPTGVFDTTNERVWHDAGKEQMAVFPLPRGSLIIL